jgi:hypothetical protein
VTTWGCCGNWVPSRSTPRRRGWPTRLPQPSAPPNHSVDGDQARGASLRRTSTHSTLVDTRYPSSRRTRCPLPPFPRHHLGVVEPDCNGAGNRLRNGRARLPWLHLPQRRHTTRVLQQPVNTVAGIAATIGAVVLALTLAKWRTTTLPSWALTVSAAGLVMVAANSWFAGTGIRAIADHQQRAVQGPDLRGTLAHRDVGTEHGAVPGWVHRAGSRRLAAAITSAVVQRAPRPRRAGIRVPGVPARASARLGRSLHRVTVAGAVITAPRRLVRQSVSGPIGEISTHRRTH